MNKFFLPLFMVSLSAVANHSLSQFDLDNLNQRYSGSMIFYNCEIDLEVRQGSCVENNCSYTIQIYAHDYVRNNEIIQNYTVWDSDLKDHKKNLFHFRNGHPNDGVVPLSSAELSYDIKQNGELLGIDLIDYQVPSTQGIKRRVKCKSSLGL